MQITLAQLRVEARYRADMERSQFIKDNELTTYINKSIAELWDLLCEAYGSDYNVESVDGSTVADQDAYDLPADFYELKGVDMRLTNNDWVTLERFNFNERNRWQTSRAWDGISEVRYRIVGNQIRFSPTPGASTEYKIWYVPTATQLTDDGDTLDELNGYSEYIVVDTAIKMLQKEESDVSLLLAQKEKLAQRIRDKAANRDAAVAATVQDVSAEEEDYFSRGVRNE